MQKIQEVNFFTPIYHQNINGSKGDLIKTVIMNIIEYYFDFGGQRVEIIHFSATEFKVKWDQVNPLLSGEPNLWKTIIKISGSIFWVFSLTTGVIPLVIVGVKYIIRRHHHFIFEKQSIPTEINKPIELSNLISENNFFEKILYNSEKALLECHLTDYGMSQLKKYKPLKFFHVDGAHIPSFLHFFHYDKKYINDEDFVKLNNLCENWVTNRSMTQINQPQIGMTYINYAAQIEHAVQKSRKKGKNLLVLVGEKHFGAMPHLCNLILLCAAKVNTINLLLLETDSLGQSSSSKQVVEEAAKSIGATKKEGTDTERTLYGDTSVFATQLLENYEFGLDSVMTKANMMVCI